MEKIKTHNIRKNDGDIKIINLFFECCKNILILYFNK